MSDWQPIETAPKDGTPIWISASYWIDENGKFQGSCPITARWTTNEEAGANFWKEGGCWTAPDRSAVIGNAFQCTYWMPLPSSPPTPHEQSAKEPSNA